MSRALNDETITTNQLDDDKVNFEALPHLSSKPMW